MNRKEYTVASLRARRCLRELPELVEILSGAKPLEEKRKDTEAFLLSNLGRLGTPSSVSRLEWVMVREATHTFLDLFQPRNERISRFSLISYLEKLLSGRWSPETEALEVPSAGFFAEMEHLVRAVRGATGIYEQIGDETPAVARPFPQTPTQRSANLNHLSHQAGEKVEQFSCGLDSDIVRRRSRNRQRIMEFFGITDVEWQDWHWHLRNTIGDETVLGELVQLTQEERQAISLAKDQGIPFAVTPFYASLMDLRPGGRGDQAVRAQVIPSLYYVKTVLKEISRDRSCMDFMQEKDTSPIEGITRRYPMICILKPVITCPQICVYCQRNWQITDPIAGNAVLPPDKLKAAVQWIQANTDIREVLVTGGDPFMLSDRKLLSILAKLARIRHITRIRIGTRTPVTLPMRITEALVRGINQYHIPSHREIVVVTHFEHPYEITREAMAAVQSFRRCGMDVYNQLVYTFYNSRRFEACALREKLRSIGVTPYYTFNTKGKEETADFRVPIARLLQEQKEELRLFPGSVRTDEVVFNVPRLGKNYLRAGQHHDIIAILPNGRRVYEFHPWEKKLARAGTYVYTDVSIYEYLKRLRRDGEPAADYRSIWYYY